MRAVGVKGSCRISRDGAAEGIGSGWWVGQEERWQTHGSGGVLSEGGKG